MSEKSKSVFETLNEINVNDHIEKKGGLSYLSWVWAWGTLKKLYPDATYTVYEDANGIPYFTDGRTGWVKTGVTVQGQEYIERLPIMDYKNKSLPLDKITSMDMNTAIQRSVTKAIARHGLGLYIYAGEDLPDGEKEKPEKKTEEQRAKDAYPDREHMIDYCLANLTPALRARMTEYYHVTQFDHLTDEALMVCYNRALREAANE